MMTTFTTNAHSYSNQAATQSETTSCAKRVNLVHSAVMCAVCTFIFALVLTVIRDAMSIIISLAIIISIISLIIIRMEDNRIYKGNGLLAVN